MRYTLILTVFLLLVSGCSDSPSDPEGNKSILQAPRLLGPENDAVDLKFSPVLRWDAVIGAKKYVLHVSQQGDFQNIDREVVLTGLTYQPQLSNQNQAYYWRVRALDGDSVGPWSEIRRFFVGDIYVWLVPGTVLLYRVEDLFESKSDTMSIALNNIEHEANNSHLIHYTMTHRGVSKPRLLSIAANGNISVQNPDWHEGKWFELPIGTGGQSDLIPDTLAETSGHITIEYARVRGGAGDSVEIAGNTYGSRFGLLTLDRFQFRKAGGDVDEKEQFQGEYTFSPQFGFFYRINEYYSEESPLAARRAVFIGVE